MQYLTDKDFETFADLLKIRKDELHHSRVPLEYEAELLKQIENGEYQQLEGQSFLKLESTLMENEIDVKLKLQFTLVSAVTLFSRAAISGGLSPDEAFSVSDAMLYYIAKAKDAKDFNELFQFAAVYFAKKVSSSNQKNLPHHVKKICTFISNNIFHKITIAELANYTNLSPNYMCKLFHSYMGVTIHKYIQSEKVEIACNFLSLTDVSILDISTYLGFKTVSNFSVIFKKWKKMSPSEYRKTYFRNVI
ncbi:TPA: helix-turn-helix transcriptional regulator [Streptococcus suis]|nr:helix-turn-helix transcriptional regulator [Streptococcus suis]HEL1906526.1 helix-turn-helix transcriptional regulator [Streptococcus suis]HEL2725487.1 helix-turn-helix transcriptional regulator [Streptococcus suis]HEM2547327.1 helix-turn-helix transcriptional regulator [Streptococcus suis]